MLYIPERRITHPRARTTPPPLTFLVRYNAAMTKLLEKALAEVSRLPAEDQDAVAADILAKVAAKNAPSTRPSSLSAEPFFGMWRDRTLDSVAWTREMRKREWSY